MTTFETWRGRPELTVTRAWSVQQNQHQWYLMPIAWHLNESGQWAGEYGESLGSFDTEEEATAAFELRQQGHPTPLPLRG